jgi:hypothetical protein
MRLAVALLACTLASVAAATDDLAAPLPTPPPPTSEGTSGARAAEPGLIPGFRIGPKLAVLPVPGLVGFGLEARIKETVTLSADFGLLPEVSIPGISESNVQSGGTSATTTITDGKVSYQDLSFAARWVPWRGAFHLGAAYGQRTVKASAKGTATSGGITASGVATLEAKSSYLAPELGWRWIWQSGFFMGLDLGWQFVLSPQAHVDVPAAAFAPGKVQDYTDLANRLASQGFPVLSLLQLGWYL